MASKLKLKTAGVGSSARDFNQLLPSFERASRASPADPILLTNLGEAYRQLERYEDAAGTLVRAVSLKPELAEASFQLGLTLRALKEPEAALACFTRATDVAPERVEHQLELGHQLRKSEDFARAVGHYQCALALSPSSLECLIGLAFSLRSLQRYEGACAMSRALRRATTSWVRRSPTKDTTTRRSLPSSERSSFRATTRTRTSASPAP
jgi:tetratricopeptide (TPR) repeat protein